MSCCEIKINISQWLTHDISCKITSGGGRTAKCNLNLDKYYLKRTGFFYACTQIHTSPLKNTPNKNYILKGGIYKEIIKNIFANKTTQGACTYDHRGQGVAKAAWQRFIQKIRGKQRYKHFLCIM